MDGGLNNIHPSVKCGGGARRKSRNFEELLKKFDQELIKGGPIIPASEGALKPTAENVREFLKTEKQGWVGGREGPHYVKIWGKSDDICVRKVAGLKVQKRWKLMKVCSEVIDEADELVENLSMKEKLKEGVLWSKDEKEKHQVWKARNIRYLNLKETKKVGTKNGPFELFCTEKGWGIEQEMWEIVARNEVEKQESLLKAIMLERKSKSKKKKLEVYRKSKKILLEHLDYCKETPGAEEEFEFKNLKEKARREVIEKEMNQRKLKKNGKIKPSQEENKLEASEAPNSNVIKKVMCPAPVHMNPSKDASSIDLGCDKPLDCSCAAVVGRKSKIVITKPQPILCRVAAETLANPGPARPTNKERASEELEPMGKRNRPGSLPGLR